MYSTNSYIHVENCVGDTIPRTCRPTYMSRHVGDRHKCLSFGGCSRQTQIPTLSAKVVVATAVVVVVIVAAAVVVVIVVVVIVVIVVAI